MEILFDTPTIPWQDHPSLKNISIKKIITTEAFGKDSPSIIMVKIPAGAEVTEHIHDGSEDMLFILAGRGTMEIEGQGRFSLRKDVVVRVPRNTRHRIFDVSEEIIVYDVFNPGIM